MGKRPPSGTQPPSGNVDARARLTVAVSGYDPRVRTVRGESAFIAPPHLGGQYHGVLSGPHVSRVDS